jgi:hypothetical protein
MSVQPELGDGNYVLEIVQQINVVSYLRQILFPDALRHSQAPGFEFLEFNPEMKAVTP